MAVFCILHRHQLKILPIKCLRLQIIRFTISTNYKQNNKNKTQSSLRISQPTTSATFLSCTPYFVYIKIPSKSRENIRVLLSLHYDILRINPTLINKLLNTMITSDRLLWAFQRDSDGLMDPKSIPVSK